eukprot:450853-Lingulodinium_polyedra.AAC.1
MQDDALDALQVDMPSPEAERALTRVWTLVYKSCKLLLVGFLVLDLTLQQFNAWISKTTTRRS